MDKTLYSSSLPPIEPDEVLSNSLTAAISELAAAVPQQKIGVFRWNDNYIAVSLYVSVNLPSRGPVGGLDIRDTEPIVLILHRQHFPYKGTFAYSDRLDFPRDQLPHLNPSTYSQPISFCLHRGNFDDWMAEHTILDLVKRVQGWLSDAARNRLIPPGDGWETIRIVNALGISIYPPEYIQNHIQQYWHFTKGNQGFVPVHYRLFSRQSSDPMVDGAQYALELLNIVEASKARKTVEKLQQLNQNFNSGQPTERHLLGLLVWASSDRVCSKYFSSIPKNLSELLVMGLELELPIEQALRVYSRNDYQILNGIPIILCIKRPTKLIGKSSELELLNLAISASGNGLIHQGVWNEAADVFPLLQRIPLTHQKASEISRTGDIGKDKFLMIGCGAIGSKLILHLARSGLTSMTLVDHDELSPHNLVRHGLLSNSIGKNKASALAEEIRAFYREKTDILEVEENAISVLLQRPDILRDHSWLVDVTASAAFLKTLIETTAPKTLRVARAEIAYEGHLGILMMEGVARNPRLDDIQIYMYNLARTHSQISAWLQAEYTNTQQELRFEEISIGLGCSTDTMPLADDVISFHSALFSRGFTQKLRQVSDEGQLQLSFLSSDNQTMNSAFQIPPFINLYAENDQSWELRISQNAAQTIYNLVKKESPNETGGILIGRISNTRKIIHIIEALPPPADSQASPFMFTRGIRDVWDSVKEIALHTGGLISYVGEWHSHPFGGGKMSSKDRETTQKLYEILKPAGLPTYIMIATPSNLHNYVFAGDWDKWNH